MKKRLILAATIAFLLFGALLIYAIFDPYLAWFHRVSHANVSVDGKSEIGWVHCDRGGKTFFLTHVAEGRKETYWLFFREQGSALIKKCAHWTAPNFPVFAIGDVNPPCWDVVVDEGVLIRPTPSRHLVAGNTEFTLNDGKRLKATW